MLLVLCELPEVRENEVDSRHDYSWRTDGMASWARYFVVGEVEGDWTRDSLTRDWVCRVLKSTASAIAVTLDDLTNNFRDS